VVTTSRVTRYALVTGAAVALVADRAMSDPSPVLWALVALGIVLGIPHGALDHLIAARVAGVRQLTAALIYAALAVAAWAALQWGGPVPLAVMIVASVAHFGLGEVEVSPILLRRNFFRSAAVAVAGSGCLVLPLARGGPGWDDTLRAMSPSLAETVALDAVRWSLVGLWVVGAAATAMIAVGDRTWSAVADVLVVGAVGAFVDPLTAFALWFGLWHGPRHMARLVDGDVRRGVPAARAVRDLAMRAAPATIGAVVTLGVVVGAVLAAGSSYAAVAAALTVLLALTAPHMVVVAALDASARRRTSASGGSPADWAGDRITDHPPGPTRRDDTRRRRPRGGIRR
jgi:Brp/Blh family beta-carotene 15,15'-monooxygenase